MRAMLASVSTQKLMKVAASSSSRLISGARLLGRALSASLADAGVVSRNALAVSVKKRCVCIVYASTFLSRLRVEKIEIAPSAGDGYPGPDEVASAAARVKEHFGLHSVGTRMIIPKAWAMVRPVEFPLAAEENLDNIISYEMDRLIPFGADEVFYDYYVIGRDERSIRLLLFAARTEAIKPYLNALKARSVEISGVGIDILEAASVYGDGMVGSSIFLRVDDEGIEGCLLTQGLVTSILPNLPMGRRGAQGGNNPIIEAVHKFLATAGRDGAPSRIVLWSDRGIETSLARETTLPVTRLTPQSLGVGLPEGSGETAPIDSVAGAVGPLLKGVKLQNLLAGGVHPRPRRPLLFSGVLALAIVAVAAVYFLMPLYFEGKRLQEIDRQIALRKNAMRRIEVIRDANERQKAEIEAIRGFRRDGVRTLTMMRELCSLLPKTVWLTRLKASDASVEMEGYAKSTADVLARLKSSTTFRKAELASPPVRDLIMDRDRFVMKIEMEGFHRNELGKEKTRQTQR